MDVLAATGSATTVDSLVLSSRQLAAITKIWQLTAAAGDRRRRATAAIGEIADYVDCDGIGLSAWNPFARGHEPVAQLGYSADVVAYTNDSRFLNDSAYRTVRKASRPQRMIDVPGIEKTDPFVSVFAPAGYAEGVVSCLHARDGRYAGMLYLSTKHDIPASADALAVLELVSTALAELTDVTHSLQTVADLLLPAPAAVVVVGDGVPIALPGRDAGGLIEEGEDLVAEAVRRAPGEAGAVSFLWIEHGELLRVYAARLGGVPQLIVGAEPTSCPLTIRELEVLTALATGATNPEIAEQLVVSRHTVGRHIEHILEKLEVGTRAAAAGVAVRDGLLLGGRAPKDRSSEG
jgi:DNA-binding CsgD family transcriptional regulator